MDTGRCRSTPLKRANVPAVPCATPGVACHRGQLGPARPVRSRSALRNPVKRTTGSSLVRHVPESALQTGLDCELPGRSRIPEAAASVGRPVSAATRGAETLARSRGPPLPGPAAGTFHTHDTFRARHARQKGVAGSGPDPNQAPPRPGRGPWRRKFPFSSLDKLALRKRLDEIGGMKRNGPT